MADAENSALLAGLERALRALSISSADEVARSILGYAALLSPSPNDALPAISTTRLFAGALNTGEIALPMASDSASKSFPAALAQALKADADLQASYQQKIAPLFEIEPAAAALQRLSAGWFSGNVTKILLGVASGGALTGDAIVRALLGYCDGLLYSRIDMARVAVAIEAVRAEENVSDAVRSLEMIQAALGVLDIHALPDIQLRLRAAATLRVQTEDLRLLHVFWTLLFGGNIALEGDPPDPSVMFSEAMRELLVTSSLPPRPTIPPANWQQAAPPTVRLAEAVQSLLRRAFEKQQRIFLNSALGAKGMVAALLTMPREELQAEPAFENVDFSAARNRFRELVRSRFADLPLLLQRWDRALEFLGALPKLNSDQPLAGAPRDHLGITNDALAIANVAAGQATSLPLAFGVFGDWGSGKTFFMRLIHEQIERVAVSSAPDDGFEHAIVQIQFNAWHYAETNLWASLVGHIFDELDRWMTRGDPALSSTADDILKRLATARQLTLEAASELAQRRKEQKKASEQLAKAQKKLVEAREKAEQAPRLAWQAALDTARRAIASDPELQQQLGLVQETLGLPGLAADQAKLVAALEELKRSASAGNAALGGLRKSLGWQAVALAIFALVGVPLLLFGLREVAGRTLGWPGLADLGRGIEVLSGLLATAAVLVTRFANGTAALAGKLAKLRQDIDQRIAEATAAVQAHVAKAEADVSAKSAQVEQAKAVLQATGEHVAAALRDYAEETGGMRLRRFVRARAGEEAYAKHLGLVSTIRKDFEQLEGLMLDREKPAQHLEEARKHYEVRVHALIKEAGDALLLQEQQQLKQAAKSVRDLEVPEIMRFRRIVLYIDDLDRCEPQKVVEVLQAVNMLLSFRLFVVIVAVDARWLSRSLETKYRELFGLAESDSRPDNARARSAAASVGNGLTHATPIDYLEKIFQIPYWVPRMTDQTSGKLVADLMAPDRAARTSGMGLGPDPPPPPPPPVDPLPGVRKGPAQDEQSESAPQPYALGLTDEEISAIKALSPFLGGSPRRARRFVNVYRVAKASLTPGELKLLEDGQFRPLATQLAIATGAPNAFGTWVAACNETSNKRIEDRLRHLVIDPDERRNLEGAIAAFRMMPGEGPDVLQRLVAQATRAARFSFVIPPKIANRPPLT